MENKCLIGIRSDLSLLVFHYLLTKSYTPHLRLNNNVWAPQITSVVKIFFYCKMCVLVKFLHPALLTKCFQMVWIIVYRSHATSRACKSLYRHPVYSEAWERNTLTPRGPGDHNPGGWQKGSEPRRSWPDPGSCHIQRGSAAPPPSQRSQRMSGPSWACCVSPAHLLTANQREGWKLWQPITKDLTFSWQQNSTH